MGVPEESAPSRCLLLGFSADRPARALRDRTGNGCPQTTNNFCPQTTNNVTATHVKKSGFNGIMELAETVRHKGGRAASGAGTIQSEVKLGAHGA